MSWIMSIENGYCFFPSQMPSVMSFDNGYCSSSDVVMDIYLQWLLFFVNVVFNVYWQWLCEWCLFTIADVVFQMSLFMPIYNGCRSLSDVVNDVYWQWLPLSDVVSDVSLLWLPLFLTYILTMATVFSQMPWVMSIYNSCCVSDMSWVMSIYNSCCVSQMSWVMSSYYDYCSIIYTASGMFTIAIALSQMSRVTSIYYTHMATAPSLKQVGSVA